METKSKKNLEHTGKILGYTVSIAGLALLFSEPTLAQEGLNRITGNLRETATSATDILSLISYVGGIGFGVKSALKFKEHNESKGQVPISQPITLAVVAAALLALPTMLTVSKESVFGGDAESSTLESGALHTIE